MENIEHRLLGLAFQIDEQVPAGDKIEMGKRRVFQHVMRRKKDQLADFFFDPVAPLEDAADARVWWIGRGGFHAPLE